ncbi:hypothetical protein BGZ89_009606 [Linnemannia elongata]|nr:hypothetical protein BGZ89_009606 [Linnemannia elongata]
MALKIITPAPKQLSSKVRAAFWMWAYIGFLSLITILPTPLVTALKPIPVYGPAYDTINEDLFIIQGGGVYQNATFTANVSQFIALDLTRPSWDVSDPPWVPVNVTSVIPLPPRLATYYHSMTISLDRQTVTIWDSASPGSVTNYTRYTGAWSTFDVPAELVRSDKQLKAAVDPNTGKIYIPLGYEGVNMMVYDPAHPNAGAATLDTRPRAVRAAAAVERDVTAPAGAGTTIGVTMPNPVKKGATGYSFVWSSYRQTFLYFGGRIGLGDIADPYFFEFQPNTNKWSTLSTNGTVPPRLINSCMISAYNGTKMILFGGHEMDGISKNATYILDVPSMEWTKGSAVDASQSRSAMACSVSGDNVVIWGGIRKTGLDPANYTTLDSTPLIFNLYFNQWVQRFERSTHYTPLPVAPASPISPPKPESTSASDKGNSNVGDIVGGTLGVVLVFALVSVGYIAHKEPQLLRRLICWGNEPDEQYRLTRSSFPAPGLQPQANPYPVNSNIDNRQQTPPATQDHPQDSGASTSPPKPVESSERDGNASATSTQLDALQQREPLIHAKTEFSPEPPRGHLTTAELSVPPGELSPINDDVEFIGSKSKSPSRGSTLSSTTTLHASDSPPASTTTSRPPVSSNILPSNSTRATHRSIPLTSEKRPNRQINIGHSPTTDYRSTSDGSVPSVLQVQPATGVLLPPSSVQSDSLSSNADVTTSSPSSQPPNELVHPKFSSSSSPSVPPKIVKPEHRARIYMDKIVEASRQQDDVKVLPKSALGSNIHGNNQRPDAKSVSSTTVTKSTRHQFFPVTISTTDAGTVVPQYPPRGDEVQHRRQTATTEPYVVVPIAHYPDGNPDVVAAPTAIPVSSATTTPRQPQGGHEPARTNSRNPQDSRGVGTRTVTFGDETPTLSVRRLSEDDERNDWKKFQ